MRFFNIFGSDRPDPDKTNQAELYLEAWKKVVEVQQHFNDISWRIRQLWLAALTFVLAATLIAFKDAEKVQLWYGAETPAVAVPVLGLILCLSFWFVDRQWYHRLLKGAVDQGSELEKRLAKHGLHVGLTDGISKQSPIKFRWLFKDMRSNQKVNVFYGFGAVLLFFLLFLVWFFG